MSKEHLSYFELKEVNEDGSFVGIASVYGIEDLGGDVIDKGAFKKTISENPTIPILWQHKNDEVIGEGSVKEWQGKILLEGKLDLEDPTAIKAYRKMKSKLIRGLSIGFNTVKSTWEDVEGRMIRHITELKLWEVSIVTFPMLTEAQVTRVKNMEEAVRVKELEKQMSPSSRKRLESAMKKVESAMKKMQSAMADHEKGMEGPMAEHDAAMEEMRAVMQDDMAEGKQDQALQAKQVATPSEPAQAAEPQQQQSSEPAEVHSALSSIIQTLKEASQNGAQR